MNKSITVAVVSSAIIAALAIAGATPLVALPGLSSATITAAIGGLAKMMP